MDRDALEVIKVQAIQNQELNLKHNLNRIANTLESISTKLWWIALCIVLSSLHYCNSQFKP